MQRLLLRPEETADLLGISRWAVYRALRDGSLESVKLGRSRRIPAEAIERYVESLHRDTTLVA